MTKDASGTIYQHLNITSGQTANQANLSISDITGTYTTNINNSCDNTNSIKSFVGIVPSVNLSCVVRTDSTYGAPNGFIYCNTLGYNPNMIVSSGVYNVNITAVNNTLIQTNPSTVLQIGAYIACKIGSMFSLGTYITGTISGGAYSISAPVINISACYFIPITIVFYYISLSLAAPNALGTTTFCVDSGSTMNLQ